jgi:regulator of chromosome condensation
MAPARRVSKRKADSLDESTLSRTGAISAVSTGTLPSDIHKQHPTAHKPSLSRKESLPQPTPENSTSEIVAIRKVPTSTKAQRPPSTVRANSKKATPPPPSRTSARLQEKTLSPQKFAQGIEPSAKRPRASPKTKEAPKAKAVLNPRRPSKVRTGHKPIAKLTAIPTERLEVFACGTGEYGELGLGPQPNAKIVKRPRLNSILATDSVGIVAIAYGGMHGVALSHDGKVYTWGVNDLGALGRVTKAKDERLKDADADSSDSDDEEDVPLNEDESTPKIVEFPEGTVITRIAAGDSVTVAVTDTGFVYGWGTFRVSLI